MTVLVTGAAGFIGAHVLALLQQRGVSAVGIDNFNAYYSVQFKRDRVAALLLGEAVLNIDCADTQALQEVFEQFRIQSVVHMAAQAGVRYSVSHPQAYIQTNLLGFANVLEACRQHGVMHLVYASSSSVYGASNALPWQEDQSVDHPLSLYAATKKANELMAHSYSHLYGLPTTGMRFFTVYGPWGRPDMAPMLFAQALHKEWPIKLFNQGNMSRDFTYIDDVAQAVVALLAKPAQPHILRKECASLSHAPYRVFNIGNRQAVNIRDFVAALEHCFSKKAMLTFEAMQSGDVLHTCADTSYLRAWIGFEPHTPLFTGLKHFADWYGAFASTHYPLPRQAAGRVMV